MKNSVVQVLKSVLAGIILTFIFAIVFSLIMTIFILPTDIIKPINQVFKIVCVFVGGVLFLRENKGLLKGAIYGALYSLCSSLLLFAVGGTFYFSFLYLLEALLCAVAGAITGVIAVNIKKG